MPSNKTLCFHLKIFQIKFEEKKSLNLGLEIKLKFEFLGNFLPKKRRKRIPHFSSLSKDERDMIEKKVTSRKKKLYLKIKIILIKTINILTIRFKNKKNL